MSAYSEITVGSEILWNVFNASISQIRLLWYLRFVYPYISKVNLQHLYFYLNLVYFSMRNELGHNLFWTAVLYRHHSYLAQSRTQNFHLNLGVGFWVHNKSCFKKNHHS